MPYTSEELKALAHTTYQQLGNADTLIEHREQLDLLPLEDKKALAAQLIEQCPEGELTSLQRAIGALGRPIASAEIDTSFHHVASKVCEIRKRIIALQDPRNRTPHVQWLAAEFNPDLFAEFTSFSLALLDGHELAIAQRLALTTPIEARSLLVRNLQNAFPDSQLVSVVGAAFAFRRQLDVLLGEEPYKFFINPEFNAETFAQYSLLLRLMEGKEEEIAAKLANTPNLKRASVSSNMAKLFPGHVLLERTTELFKTPLKETVHEGSLFSAAPSTQVVEESKKNEHETSLRH